MITVGIDEVGRGCWAGPLVAGAVILDEKIAGLKDSEKLSKAQREKLVVEIRAKAQAIGLGWASPAEVDEVGLTEAVRLAMQRALGEIQIPFDEIIIDGNYNFFPDNPKAKVIIKADDSVPAVSAASIVSKVARDKFMHEQAELFPAYGFEKHVGYGTAAHLMAVKAFGVCSLHRLSYKPIRAIMELAA